MHGHDPSKWRSMPRTFEAGKVVAPALGGGAHQRPQVGLGQFGGAIHVDVGDTEDRGERLQVGRRARVVVRHAGHGAQVGVPRRIHHRTRLQDRLATFVPQAYRMDQAVLHLDARRPRVQEDLDPRFVDEPLPHDLEGLGVVCDPGAGAIRVRSLEGDPRRAQMPCHLPPDATDHPPRFFSRCVEGIEGVEDCCRSAAQEREAIDEQRSCPAAGGADRRRAAGRARAHDDDIESLVHFHDQAKTPAALSTRIFSQAGDPTRFRKRGTKFAIR